MKKRIKIDNELRKKIINKLEELNKIESKLLNGARSYEWYLLTTYSYSATIREDIYKELCGII